MLATYFPNPIIRIYTNQDIVGLGSHGSTVHYQLLLGGTDSKRDRIAAGRWVTSLYIMDFSPGGTNHPHHHENAVEIYYMLAGHGQMVAGTSDGDFKWFPANAADAFLFTRNSLVGFFSGTQKEKPHSRILAIRTLFPQPEVNTISDHEML